MGGNDEIIRLAAREISNRHAMLGGAASYWTLALGALRQRADTHGMPIPGHAGDFEAALVAALRPDLISLDQPAPPKGAASALSLPSDVPVFAQPDHSMQRIGGYTDRSGVPSAALGQTMLTVVRQEVARALVAFHRAWPPAASA
jgi:creatinine amidohydrolase